MTTGGLHFVPHEASLVECEGEGLELQAKSKLFLSKDKVDICALLETRVHNSKKPKFGEIGL